MATNGAPWTSEVIASMQADIRAFQAQAGASATTGGDNNSAPAPSSTSSGAAAGAQSAPAPPRPPVAQGQPGSPPPSPSASGHRHSPRTAAAAGRPLTPPAPGARLGSSASAQGPAQPAGYDNLLHSFARLTPSSRERLLADVAALGCVPAPGEAPPGGVAAAAGSDALAVGDAIGTGPYSRALGNLASCQTPAPSHSAGKRARDSPGLASGPVAPFYRRAGPRPASHTAAQPASATAPAIAPTSVVRHATAFVPGTTLTSAIDRPSSFRCGL
ncbi:hypothetical protein V8E36_006803 [Tilletia maclaganii]